MGGGGGAGERVFVVFSILERLRGGWLNIPLWCVSGVGGGVGRGSSVFTHTHTLLKGPVPFAFIKNYNCRPWACVDNKPGIEEDVFDSICYQ